MTKTVSIHNLISYSLAQGVSYTKFHYNPAITFTDILLTETDRSSP